MYFSWTTTVGIRRRQKTKTERKNRLRDIIQFALPPKKKSNKDFQIESRDYSTFFPVATICQKGTINSFADKS